MKVEASGAAGLRELGTVSAPSLDEALGQVVADKTVPRAREQERSQRGAELIFKGW